MMLGTLDRWRRVQRLSPWHGCHSVGILIAVTLGSWHSVSRSWIAWSRINGTDALALRAEGWIMANALPAADVVFETVDSKKEWEGGGVHAAGLFANRVFRLATKSKLVQQCEKDTLTLLCMIATGADDSGAAAFWNKPLRRLGFAKWERLDRARKALINAV